MDTTIILFILLGVVLFIISLVFNIKSSSITDKRIMAIKDKKVMHDLQVKTSEFLSAEWMFVSLIIIEKGLIFRSAGSIVYYLYLEKDNSLGLNNTSTECYPINDILLTDNTLIVRIQNDIGIMPGKKFKVAFKSAKRFNFLKRTLTQYNLPYKEKS